MEVNEPGTDSHADSLSPDFKPARFPVELGLPPAEDTLFQDAKTAVRQEFRDCSKWKRLRCRKVSVIAERGRGTIYALHLGMSIEFDWTWEGSMAFRPEVLGVDGDGIIDLADFEESPVEEASSWSGEILEVDERNGCLFISLTNPEAPPTTGPFLVRPFEFLAGLDAVYHVPRFNEIRTELQARLAAAAGGIHPPIARPAMVGLRNLQKWWQHSWSVLWGPPGTGKTFTTGQQVAGVLNDQRERILVVSTTNRATDAVALSIGKAAREQCPKALDAGKLLRIGKGAAFPAFRDADLESMLHGAESDTLAQIGGLAQQIQLFEDREDKALARKKLVELRTATNDQSRRVFVDPSVRVVIATAFKAMSLLNDDLVSKIVEAGDAPFTTVFIDEAGLISRAAVAALSLLASRRVVLVGDSKQLAPISRISRILPTRQETWLAKSGLSHLDDIQSTPPAVHVLAEQHRMHTDLCRVVSNYQYGGILTTAPTVMQRGFRLPSLLADGPRAIWYVLDEEGADLASIRAERGPGNRSWMRSITPSILAKLFSDPAMKESEGLFITPYTAQAEGIGNWLAAEGIKRWESSTVHSQQGSEAEFVVFDTVNAGSCNWPFEEWKRLINVALSRAKEAVIVLASRHEMDEPYLRPLLNSLTPRVLELRGGKLTWRDVEATPSKDYSKSLNFENTLGGQIAARKLLTPVLSQEQQRLTNLELDGKPRLVRGVAGSGKTLVLSNWLAKTAKRKADVQDARIWAVYANRSLHTLLRQSIEGAWKDVGDGAEFPWDKVSLLHVKDVLAGLLSSVSLSMEAFGFEYDRAAEEFLNRQNATTLAPRCDALFIDEAQDMGPNTLRLLLSLVEQTDQDDRNSRSAHIFFDNAQNLYERKTPKWSDFGLDLRGRSTIMKESFRSTNPITELAVNVLHRLSPVENLHDHKELMSLGLIERTDRNGDEWLRVRYNQVSGPKPLFRLCESRSEELEAIGDLLTHLISKEGISPEDICVIYNGKSVVELLESKLAPVLSKIGIELTVQTNRSFERKPNTLLATTCHSYKGYEAEVVLIPCVDRFTTQDSVLVANLYVAMTRARSLLAIYSMRQADSISRRVNETLQRCVDLQHIVPEIDTSHDEAEGS